MAKQATNESLTKGLDVVKIRLVKETPLFKRRIIRNTEDAINCLIDEMSELDREFFCILNLRSDGSVINFNVVSQGVLSSTLISPREVFKSSILSNSAGIVMFHNHPSGDVTPSLEDIATTQRLAASGRILDIKVVDHIIVGAQTKDYYSFRANGQLEEG